MSAGDEDEEVERHGREGARAAGLREHGLGALRRAQKTERRLGNLARLTISEQNVLHRSAA